MVGQGLRDPRGRRPPEEDAGAEVEHHAAPGRPPSPGHVDSRPVSRQPHGHRGGRRRCRGPPSSADRPARSTQSATAVPCGNPDVVATEPRLDDGTPFPTTFYLTCPRAASMIGTLEASGLMREMTERLAEDESSPRPTAAPTRPTWQPRSAIGEVPEISGVSAGGMPDRVSACTCSPARRWPRAAGSTRSATRCSTSSGSGGLRALRRAV